jgi:predicted kinase
VSKLVITRGLPASGKTTFAKAWVAECMENRVRVNRDDLRKMFDDGVFLDGVTEPRIVKARDELIVKFLRAGYDVINDDTNLPNKVVKDLWKLALKAGAEFEIVDLTDVDVDTCRLRNSTRKDDVPGNVLEDMYRRYVRGKPHPLPVPDKPAEAVSGAIYEPRRGRPRAVIVDIDGTVARMDGRGPHDYHLVSQDLPRWPVIRIVEALAADGVEIIFVSGRPDSCRQDTEDWLYHYVGVPIEALFMRKTGDHRNDAVVKLEIFNDHIRDHYNVENVLDDRDRVVEMWRTIGLSTLQVAPGCF